MLLLRLLVTILSLIGAAIFHTFSPLNVSVLFLLAVVAGIAASIVFGFWRLRHATLISQKELFAQGEAFAWACHAGILPQVRLQEGATKCSRNAAVSPCSAGGV